MRTRYNSAYGMHTCMLVVALLTSSCEFFDEDEIKKGSIEYPAAGFYGPNVLARETTSYNTGICSLEAKIPHDQQLKITITSLNDPYPEGGVWYYTASNNWAISDFDFDTGVQVFRSIDGGLTSTLRMYFNAGSFRIDYYENGETLPSTTETIEVTE